MTVEMPFIEFSVDEKNLDALLEKYDIQVGGNKKFFSVLPSLTFAERVLWAITGVKKCSSFEYKRDVESGRCTEEDVLLMLQSLNLQFNPSNDCYPESTISLVDWSIDKQKAHMDLPYRERDGELARWFGYPSCCVTGYREYFDQKHNNILAKHPFKEITTAKELDTYVYPNGRVSKKRFGEVVDHFQHVNTGHPHLSVSRSELIEPIRNKMSEFYEDKSFYLLLHFCLPVHDPHCSAFRTQTKEMHTILQQGAGEKYADAIIQRSWEMDQQSDCF